MAQVGMEVGLAILSPVISLLIEKMTSVDVRAFFRRHELDERQLEKLKVTLRTVTKVVGDAEEKQFTNPHVRAWFDDLKDAAFKAEDFLDEVAYANLKLKIEACGQTITDAMMQPETCMPQVCKIFPSFNLCRKGMTKGDMEPRLKEIHETMQHLVRQMGPLGLENNIGEETKSKDALPTTSLIDASDVCGRGDDEECIVELLQSGDTNGKNIGVVLIVGMGGLGKTTLAQLVYNNHRVQEQFDVRAWVYVPKELDFFHVIRDIMKEVGLGNGDGMTANQMHCKLEKKLSGSRVFLVLDDVWNASQGGWDSLIKPFMSVKNGSKIIVTTRNASVARVMSTVIVHRLAELSDDDCWLLFAKHAFDGEGGHKYPVLEKIGRAMMKKCKGLPLAAKTLGRLLRYERHDGQWRKILMSNMWDSPNSEILPALRLSYHYLPSNLKQCFAYCAIFPKNHKFEREEVVLLWIAEGFILQSDGDKMEVGEKYFEDLVSRCFFQQQSNYGESFFTMHDLINDLATHVSREFCFRLEGGNFLEATLRARYLSCIITRDHEAIHNSKVILDTPHFLRTLIVAPRCWSCCLVGSVEWHNFLLRFKSLRVLCLPSSSRTLILPNAIGILKHLRYLNLENHSTIEQLPESICNLYNLQILILRNCSKLTKLPNDMRKLVNLFLLDIDGTRLQEMPPHMGELTRLCKLTNFVLGKQSGSSIKELGKLQNLQGELCIQGLQNVVDARDVTEANLKGKQHLEALHLTWDEDYRYSLHQEVLQELIPHKDLKSLSIKGYGDATFGDWVGDASFSCMVFMGLYECKIHSLPRIWQLVSLETLTIHTCDRIKTIGPELYSMKKLKYLRIFMLPEWCEWISDEGSDSFPLLEHLTIQYCPKLRKALPSQLPSVTRIEIGGCEELDIGCFPLECFPKLEELNIWCCPKLVSFSKGRLPSFNLATLHLILCSNLRALPECVGSIKSLSMVSCPKIKSFSFQGLGSNSKLRELTVEGCKKLIARRNGWGLQTLPSLSDFTIGNCNEVESFPEKTLLPATLTSLHITNLPNLKSLNYEGLQHLTSLRSLHIQHCPNLKAMPNEKLPPSLSFLYMDGCPLLKKRCEPENGEDWPKISHIREISIY